MHRRRMKEIDNEATESWGKNTKSVRSQRKSGINYRKKIAKGRQNSLGRKLRNVKKKVKPLKKIREKE